MTAKKEVKRDVDDNLVCFAVEGHKEALRLAHPFHATKNLVTSRVGAGSGSDCTFLLIQLGTTDAGVLPMEMEHLTIIVT
jgi:hypothetical protein